MDGGRHTASESRTKCEANSESKSEVKISGPALTEAVHCAKNVQPPVTTTTSETKSGGVGGVTARSKHEEESELKAIKDESK